jgi:hypothetical protein
MGGSVHWESRCRATDIPTATGSIYRECFRSSPAHWELYPGESLEVDVKPDFGQVNVFVALFVPKIRLWFDPARPFEFVGAETARYYKGLPFKMVRQFPH